MRFAYTQDLLTGLWLVLKGDVVIAHKETEEEAVRFIEYMKNLEAKEWTNS